MEAMNQPDLIVRQPTEPEMDRIRYLFRNVRLHPQARMLVAVRSRPIKRFIAAAAWWPEGTIGVFRLASQPGVTQPTVYDLLVSQVTECAKQAGLETLQNGEPLLDNSEWIEILKRNGFVYLRSERFFEVTGLQSWTRTMEIYKKYQNKIPTTWRTESIRQHTPEAILNLIDAYRLMPPSELRDYWRSDAALGFELEYSCILFDGPRPIGVLLVRQVQNTLCVDVRVVRAENRLLRSLGNIVLFYHIASRRDPYGPIHQLQFRGGATEHLETANLSGRMGGRELPARHFYSKKLL